MSRRIFGWALLTASAFAGPAASAATCETTLKLLESLAHPRFDSEIAALRAGSAKLKGEMIDIFEMRDGAEHLLGRADRAVAHRTRLMHRATVALVVLRDPTTARPQLFLQEFYSDTPKGEVFLLGGHVKAGTPYQESMERELIEELGLPANSLPAGRLSRVGREGQFEVNAEENHERLSIYVYEPSPAERSWIQDYAKSLAEQRRRLGDEAYGKWLLAQQTDADGNPTGLGEIRGIHLLDVDTLLNQMLPAERYEFQRGDHAYSFHWELIQHLREPDIVDSLRRLIE